MADDLQHGGVGFGVGVREARGEVVSVLLGQLFHRLGLVRTVGVVLDLAGVAAVDLDESGGDDVVRPEHLADRLDDLGAGRRHDDDVASGGVVVLDELDRLVEDDRVDDRVQGLGHRLTHDLDVPAGDHLGEVVAHLLELVVVGAAGREHELGVGAAEHGATAQQAAVVEGPAEGERARLGDDRLVQVEERGRTGFSVPFFLGGSCHHVERTRRATSGSS